MCIYMYNRKYMRRKIFCDALESFAQKNNLKSAVKFSDTSSVRNYYYIPTVSVATPLSNIFYDTYFEVRNQKQ